MNSFVNPPYIDCPKCEENFFGVLSIGEFQYSRKCAKCNYPSPIIPSETFPLPELKKKVIYLDQFFISNMVKSLHPDFKKKIDPFFRIAFEKLDRLSKLQIIICPDSQFHEEESIFSKYPAEHKKVYELLSHGVSYRDCWTILRFQICEQLQNWLANKPMGETAFKPQDFTNGKINDWQDRLLITVNSGLMERAKSDLNSSKYDSFEILKKALNRWEDEKSKPFNYWFDMELIQWPWIIWDGYQKYLNTVIRSLNGLGTLNPFEILPTPFYLIFWDISKIIKKSTKSENEYFQKLNKFLLPENLKQVPFIRIYSMLFASLAEKISSGHMKTKNVKHSIINDILMISTLLPFCDGIFLDKQMAGFLKDFPLKNVLKKMPTIFSLSNKEGFLNYLDNLERNTSEDHFKKVTEVYGEEWSSPYTGVLKDFRPIVNL